MRDAIHPALRLKPFVAYKSINAFFQGVWGTAYVALMAPLPPEAFSIGPLAFALGPLLVALAYSRLLNLPWFFRISVSVEVIALLSVVAVLLYPQSFLLAAGVYLGFQLALIFGNYLVRLETLVIAKESFKPVDIGKTLGSACWSTLRTRLLSVGANLAWDRRFSRAHSIPALPFADRAAEQFVSATRLIRSSKISPSDLNV